MVICILCMTRMNYSFTVFSIKYIFSINSQQFHLSNTLLTLHLYVSLATFGAFGPDALALLRTLSRRSGRTVPPSLLEEASWATPVFASFARMSLSLSMRRSLAYRLREAGVTESAARVLARQPAPVPEDPDRAFDAPESG